MIKNDAVRRQSRNSHWQTLQGSMQAPSSLADLFCKGVIWICILFFNCTKALKYLVQISKYLGDCEAKIEIYSGQVYRNEWPWKPMQLNKRSFLMGKEHSEGINIIKFKTWKPRFIDIKAGLNILIKPDKYFFTVSFFIQQLEPLLPLPKWESIS